MRNEQIRDLEGIIAEHRNLAVLRALLQLDGSANEHVISDHLDRLALGGREARFGAASTNSR